VLPRLKLAVDEVVVGTEQLDGALLQRFLHERVGHEVLKGHVHGFLQNIQRSELRGLNTSSIGGSAMYV
jgi:hypothetical protein